MKVNQLAERVSKSEKQIKEEKDRSRLLFDTQNKLKAELQKTKETLAQVILERDQGREIILKLRERNDHLLDILSENIKCKNMTMQRNEEPVQKRTRLTRDLFHDV